MPADPLALPIGLAPHLLEVFEVAHYLRLCDEAVRRLIRRGQLPAIRVAGRLRVDPRDVDAFVAAGRLSIDEARDEKRPAILLQLPRAGG
jgi:excisionase family DNA binding protein